MRKNPVIVPRKLRYAGAPKLGGRPKSKNPKNGVIKFRVTPWELISLKTAASLTTLSVSEVARRLVGVAAAIERHNGH
jgi:hypothetical protein